MKLSAEYQNRAYLIEIEPADGSDSSFLVTVSEAEREDRLRVEVVSRSQGRWTLKIGSRIEDLLVWTLEDEIVVDWRGRTFSLRLSDLREKLQREFSRPGLTGVARIRSQMPGRVITVQAAEGDLVKAGQGLVVIEAMKMQNELKSPKAGRVSCCRVQAGDRVSAGQLLFEIV